MSEDLHAEVVHDALTDERREQRADVLHRELYEHRPEIQSRQQAEEAHVSMGDRDVERMLRQTRTDEGEPGLGQKQQKSESRQSSVRSDVPQQATEECRVVARDGDFGIVLNCTHGYPAGSATAFWSMDLSPLLTQFENTRNPNPRV